MLATVLEYSGMPPIPSLDRHSANPNQSPAETLPIFTGIPNTLVVAALLSQGLPTPYSPGPGWTTRFTQYNLGGVATILEDRFVPLEGTSVVGDTTPLQACAASVNLIASFNAQSPVIGFPVGWFCWVENIRTGVFSLQSNSKIDESSSNVLVPQNPGVILVFDGTNWKTFRGDPDVNAGNITGILPIVHGGTGTATPSLITS